jgi:membrane-associated phospholipid phosphatase
MQVIKQNILFFTLLLSYLCIGAFYIVSHVHGDEILYINTIHQPGLDFFFKYASHIGEGLFFGVVIVLLGLLVSYYHAIVGLCTFILSTLMVQIPKRLIFEDQIRPHKYFLGKVKLNLVEGVEVHHFNSFPSGHTGSAFALAMFLTLYTKNKYYSIIYFLAAVCVALSRMYLFQHFLRDVYVGAILGVMASLIVYYIFENVVNISPQSKLNNALFNN